MCSRKTLGLLVLLALFPSCAQKRPPKPSMPQPPAAEQVALVVPAAPEVDFEELYRHAEGYAVLYDEGVELIVAGQEVLGERKIADATNGMRADAEECSHFTDCNMRVFLDAFDRLLTDQGIALKQQVLRVEELQASVEEDVEREPGTSPFAAAIPQLGRSASMLRGTDLKEIITLNGPVKAALDDWLTWMRPKLMDSYHQLPCTCDGKISRRSTKRRGCRRLCCSP